MLYLMQLSFFYLRHLPFIGPLYIKELICTTNNFTGKGPINIYIFHYNSYQEIPKISYHVNKFHPMKIQTE